METSLYSGQLDGDDGEHMPQQPPPPPPPHMEERKKKMKKKEKKRDGEKRGEGVGTEKKTG